MTGTLARLERPTKALRHSAADALSSAPRRLEESTASAAYLVGLSACASGFFRAHVLELARECSDVFPAVSDRFLILSDALTDLGEEQAAEHCWPQEHVPGCHVLDAILGRS